MPIGAYRRFCDSPSFEDGFDEEALGDLREAERFDRRIECHIDPVDSPSGKLFALGNAGGDHDIGGIIEVESRIFLSGAFPFFIRGLDIGAAGFDAEETGSVLSRGGGCFCRRGR